MAFDLLEVQHLAFKHKCSSLLFRDHSILLRTQGAVSISTADHPTGQWIILLWRNNMGRWPFIRSDGQSCLLKYTPGPSIFCTLAQHILNGRVKSGTTSNIFFTSNRQLRVMTYVRTFMYNKLMVLWSSDTGPKYKL